MQAVHILIEPGKTTVDGSSQSGRIIAAPVQDRQNIYNTVSCLELRLNPSRYRYLIIFAKLGVLFRCIHSNMTAGNHPEDVIVIQRNIPLYIPGAVFKDVIQISTEWRAIGRIQIPMPSAMPCHDRGRDCTLTSSRSPLHRVRSTGPSLRHGYFRTARSLRS